MDVGDLVDEIDEYDEGYGAITEDEIDDADFLEFAVHITFPRAGKTIRKRPNLFQKYSNSEFLQRFRLTKKTVRFLVELIKTEIASQVTH